MFGRLMADTSWCEIRVRVEVSRPLFHIGTSLIARVVNVSFSFQSLLILNVIYGGIELILCIPIVTCHTSIATTSRLHHYSPWRVAQCQLCDEAIYFCPVFQNRYPRTPSFLRPADSSLCGRVGELVSVFFAPTTLDRSSPAMKLSYCRFPKGDCQ